MPKKTVAPKMKALIMKEMSIPKVGTKEKKVGKKGGKAPKQVAKKSMMKGC